MANVKISNLTAASTPLAGTEVLPVVQSGATVKASIANVQTATYSGGTANGVAYLDGSKVLTTGSALVFDGTNFGVGVTPSAWNTSGAAVFKVIEYGKVGTAVAGLSSGSELEMLSNAYYNGGWKYANTGVTALRASLNGDIAGAFSWNIAPSGTAGNAITFTQAMTLDSSGNLLVGTTSFSYNPAQGTTIATGSVGSIGINHANGTTSGNGYANFVYNTTNIGSITQNGTTAVAYNTSSDYRLKENIAPLTGALARVTALKPCTYTWKSAPDEIGEGFIAHELAEVVPQCVTGKKDAVEEQQYEITPAVKDEDGNTVTEAVMGTRTVPKYQGIDTSFLVATLTAAIQEQQALITQLQADVAALKGT